MTGAGRRVAAMLLSGCVSAGALAGTASDIELLVRERIDAAARGDAAAWRRHIADDCVWTGPGLANGTTSDAQLAITANASLPRQPATIREFEVHEFGDTVLATYVFTSGPDASGLTKRFRKSDTYVRRDGDWRLVSAVENLVPARAVARTDPASLDAYVGRTSLAADTTEQSTA